LTPETGTLRPSLRQLFETDVRLLQYSWKFIRIPGSSFVEKISLHVCSVEGRAEGKVLEKLYCEKTIILAYHFFDFINRFVISEVIEALNLLSVLVKLHGLLLDEKELIDT